MHHASNGRSVYSFCMCPGGRVVAATSETGCVATNGMSQYSRDEFNANAGIVVGITPRTMRPTSDAAADPLAGIAFQREWERRAYRAGGGTYAAPAQLVGDFLASRASRGAGYGAPSYKPGVTPADLAACLPGFAIDGHPRGAAGLRPPYPRLRHARRGADRRRDAHVLPDPHHPWRGRTEPEHAGLFPAGEGAGYAGGIMSAGVDGIRVAEAVASSLTGTPLVERMTQGEGVRVYG